MTTPETPVELATATPEHIEFLRKMCHAAVFKVVGLELPEDEIPSIDEAMNEHELGAFVDGFGREGDYGIIAHKGDVNVGAAWYRRYDDKPDDLPAYELSIAVEDEHQGEGIGPRMITSLLQHAHQVGIPEMSLQVHQNNEVGLKTYARLGFQALRQSDDHGYILMVVPTAAFSQSS